MSFWRWGATLLQRILLLALAGVLVILLLHVQTGIVPGGRTPAQPTSWVTSKWIGASRAYLTQLAHGNLGTLKALKIPKYTQDQPVSVLLAKQAPASLYLIGTALVFSLLVGTLLGLAASKFGWRLLRGTTLTGTLLLMSAPDILLVFLLRKLVIWGMATFGIRFFSTAVFGDLQAADLIAPALALSALPVALVARTAAVAFDEVFDALYIRTAKGKGVHPLRVVLGHALKNAWLRVADAGALIAGSLVTGLVIVEYSFYYPGLGRTLGLVLERKGQPEASSSIAVVLLVGALLLDLLFEAVRLGLDPRLRERRSEALERSRFRLPDVVGALKGLAEWPGMLWGWLRELPYQAVRAVWAWRPGRVLRALFTSPPLLIGTVGVLALLALAVFGGQLSDLRTAGNAPKYITWNDRVYFPPYQPGLPGFPLGSDVAGRDMAARLLVGARYTILFTLAVTPVRFLLAVPWGLIAGFRRGLWAGAGRTVGLVFSALPVILIPASLLPLQALVGPLGQSKGSFWAITAVLAIIGIPRLVENVRLQVEGTLVQPFVEGARAAGAGSGRILFKHVLPHLAPHLWVSAAADMAWTLMVLAQLGVFSIYLGGSAFAMTGTEMVGNSSGATIPRVPDWSSMLARPYDVIYKAPWSIWVPALAFALAIIAFNLTAEGLRRRAQRLSASPAIPEPVAGADGVERIPARAVRRLTVDWVVGLAVLAVAAVYIGRYGFKELPSSAAAVAAEAAKSPLERTRDSMQVVMDQVFGTGDQLERSKAATDLDRVMTAYLGEAYKAKSNSAQVQQDTRGRALVFEIDGVVRLVQVQVPDVGQGSHMYFQDLTSGFVQPFQDAFKPAYVGGAKLADGYLLAAAGTIPGPDNWAIALWQSDGSGHWGKAGERMQRLFSRIPADYKAQLNAVTFSRSTTVKSIEMTLGPLYSIRVAPNADLRFCQSEHGPCVDLPFQGDGY